jgi:hypothetical protein
VKLRTYFPNWDRDKLISRAWQHVNDLAMDRAWEVGASWTPTDNASDTEDHDLRVVVNMLRHEHTDYDDDQSNERHAAACRRISEKFPWLAEECERQIRTRKAQDEMYEDLAQSMAEQEREAKAARRNLIAASREACKTLQVGQVVNFKILGHDRTGAVTKAARSKVIVSYAIKSGAKREACIYAGLVTRSTPGQVPLQLKCH